MDFSKMLNNIFNNNKNDQINPQPQTQNPIPKDPIPFTIKDKSAALSDLTGEWVFQYSGQPHAIIFMPRTLSFITKENRRDIPTIFKDMVFYNSQYWTITVYNSFYPQDEYTFIRRYQKFYIIYKHQEILLQQFNSY